MFSWAVVCYLTLGGAGGGLLLLASSAGLCVPSEFMRSGVALPYRSLLGVAFRGAAAILLLASLLLLADVGNIHAIDRLFLSGRVTFLTVGAWALLAGIAVAALLSVFWRGDVRFALPAARALLVAGVLLGFAIALYTGLFLACMQSVPLWNTPWLPALFVASSISCGAALISAVAHVTGAVRWFSRFFRMVGAVDAAAVCAEAVLAAGMVASLLLPARSAQVAQAQASSLDSLLCGEWAWAWWGGFVAVGLAAVLLLDVVMLGRRRESGRPYAAACAAACAIVGSLALRACLVMAGQHPVAGL